MRKEKRMKHRYQRYGKKAEEKVIKIFSRAHESVIRIDADVLVKALENLEWLGAMQYRIRRLDTEFQELKEENQMPAELRDQTLINTINGRIKTIVNESDVLMLSAYRTMKEKARGK
jgi:hypothetical protein